jgi:hypothetical protein
MNFGQHLGGFFITMTLIASGCSGDSGGGSGGTAGTAGTAGTGGTGGSGATGSGGAGGSGGGNNAACEAACDFQFSDCGASGDKQGCLLLCESSGASCANCMQVQCDCITQCIPSGTGGTGGTLTPEDCATGQDCVFDSDCPNGQRCNGSAKRCIDTSVDPFAHDCSQTPCVFDVDCPDGYACNSASNLCFKK